MKKIALDLDGVVYNYSATACYLMNHYKGYNLDWTETNSWNWLQSQVSNNDWQWLWSGGVKEGLFRYGHLIKGAAEGVKELSKLGKIIVVTSRPTNAIQDTLDWLSFMKFPVSGVHILSNGENKGTIKADVAIDDKPENIEDYAAAGTPVIIFTQKYNEGYRGQWTAGTGVPLIHRANGWKDVVLAVEKILGR